MSDDIAFLTDFRNKIDTYLFLGYAPSQRGVIPPEMVEALLTDEFQQLRREINEMKSRAHDLLNRCGVHTIVKEYPPPAIGGPVQSFKLFDLVTDNRTSYREQKVTFFDKIDEAIGALKAGDTIEVAPSSEEPQPSGTSSREVFIVHGHDKANMLELEKLLQNRWGLDSIIVGELAGESRTLIEIIEQEGPKAGYAFVLMTPDDTVEGAEAPYRQARPNVFFELGWFFGHLKRNRVCIIAQQDAKVSTDLEGIRTIRFRDSINEKVLEIGRELEQAGLSDSS